MFNLFQIPASFWLTLEPNYTLPSGMSDRIYTSEYHKLRNDQGQEFPAEHPWVDGDRYLANAQTYITLWRRNQGEIVPDLGAFRVGMIADAGYNRIAAIAASQPATAHLLANLSAAMVVQPIHYESVVMLWNVIITSLPTELRPTLIEASAWQVLATNSQIPLTFTADGLLNLVS